MSKSQGQHRIFVVDDEPIIASTLGQILKLRGFEVSCFTNPLKALEAVYMEAPDLLLADVIMPEMSGIDLAIVVREAFPSCTVLLFSGQIATSQLLEGAKPRGHDFEVLTKPVHPLVILERVCDGLGLKSGTGGSTKA
jgi:DNA-binding response OmpR family regulator